MISPAEGRAQPWQRILAASMWAIFNFDDPNRRYQKFLKRGRCAFNHFFDSLLLYDEVLVPTQDFLSLIVLTGVLGERAVLDLMESGDLRFCRLKGSLAYVGNGGGIQSYEIRDRDDKTLMPFCADLEAAIRWAVSGLDEKPRDPAFARMVLSHTEEVAASELRDHVRHETYMDVLKSPSLRNLFSIRSQHMDYLAGIGPKGVRIYGGPDADSWVGDEIDIVMSLASANAELYLAQHLGCTDSSTNSPVGHLLKAKAERTPFDAAIIESFTHVKQINDVPDIASAVLDRPIPERAGALSAIMRVKRSRNGRAFREWFHANCRDNPDDVAREYVQLLSQVPAVRRMPVRIVRYLVTAIAGLVPVLGAVASAIDSFFLESWLQGRSPKFFIRDLTQVVQQDETGNDPG